MKRRVYVTDLLDIIANLSELKVDLLVDWSNDLVDQDELEDLINASDNLSNLIKDYVITHKVILEKEGD